MVQLSIFTWFNNLADSYKGLLITLSGVLLLTPDALLIRLSSSQGTDNNIVQFYRYGLAGSVLLVVMMVKDGANWIQKFRNLSYLGVFAGLLWGGNNFLFTYSIQHAPVANVLVILASNPMFSALFSRILLKESIPWRTVIMCCVSFTIIALIFADEFDAEGSQYTGMIGAVVCSLTLGLFFTIVRLESKLVG